MVMVMMVIAHGDADAIQGGEGRERCSSSKLSVAKARESGKEATIGSALSGKCDTAFWTTPGGKRQQAKVFASAARGCPGLLPPVGMGGHAAGGRGPCSRRFLFRTRLFFWLLRTSFLSCRESKNCFYRQEYLERLKSSISTVNLFRQSREHYFVVW